MEAQLDVAIQVSAVRDLDGLSALAPDWETVHGADPESDVFTSFAWMRGRLSALAEPWWVLVARSEASSRIVGLLPLRLGSSAWDRDEDWLAMAGSPLADYTGFLCLPGFENEVLAAFASYVQQRLIWQQLEIRDVRDPRLETFLGHFTGSRFEIVRRPPTPCPYLELDGSWEGYLRTGPSSRTRQTIRRKLRAIERLPDLRRTTLEDDAERQISIFLELWQMRWGKRPEPQLEEYRSIFLSCLAAGDLWLDVLWDGDVPITGLLAFLDRRRSWFCFYLTGFDARYAALSPGMVIVAHSLREAIRDGYEVYDFLRGDEPYKFSLGAETRHTENVAVLRRATEE